MLSDSTPEFLLEPPLVVPWDKQYEASGHGVVSHRTMVKVGYNGLAFRKLTACPEMSKDLLVREAWPAGLLLPGQCSHGEAAELEYGSESCKCAPEN